MKEILERARGKLENQKALAVGFLRGEIGRVGPIRVRPANALTLVWLQAVFGSVEGAFAPLLGHEPSVERLIHILAILHVSTDRRKTSYEKAKKRIEKLRRRAERMSAEEIINGLRLLVMAFEGMKNGPSSPDPD